MIRKPTGLIFFLLLFASIYGGSAVAETAVDENTQLNLSLGVGGAYSSNPYRGADAEFVPFPLVVYEGERFFFRGTRAGYYLYRKESLSFSLLASYRMDGYESGDSAFLQGMSDRDGTLEAGLQTTLATPVGSVRASLLSDLLAEHSGHEARLSLSKRFPLDGLSVSPFAAAIWQSGQLTNYYYGVRGVEATASRPAYKVDSAILLQLGTRANYRLTDAWSLTGQVAVTRLADEISDSPIVEDDFVASGFLGIGYRF